jgi:hypothetical protein
VVADPVVKICDEEIHGIWINKGKRVIEIEGEDGGRPVSAPIVAPGNMRE